MRLWIYDSMDNEGKGKRGDNIQCFFLQYTDTQTHTHTQTSIVITFDKIVESQVNQLR